MRRSKATALKTKTVVTSIVICAGICLAGVGYVWAKTQVWRLSQDVKKLEGRLEELKRDNSILQRTYAAMCAPGKLDERVRELNLGLVVPLRSQIVRMPTEVVPLAQGQPQTLRYAATNHD